MNLVFVDRAKNIKNAVALYKKNIKQLSKTTITKEIPKFILDLKNPSIKILIFFFLTLVTLKLSN